MYCVSKNSLIIENRSKPMKAPGNRRVFVVGYGAATPLGKTFPETWKRAVKGEAGFRKVTRCRVNALSHVVGEIPDWNPLGPRFR